jgi:hypothetical protein
MSRDSFLFRHPNHKHPIKKHLYIYISFLPAPHSLSLPNYPTSTNYNDDLSTVLSQKKVSLLYHWRPTGRDIRTTASVSVDTGESVSCLRGVNRIYIYIYIYIYLVGVELLRKTWITRRW